ncbi:glycosyl hydrolase 53 family protein [uncultured Winogradskyella sp.]|uniref:glycoside hydrolase family 53 protein n=1 Tax=uncultured Winogradskyella sp. TaxID=395353 RepID=UPI00260316C7|nr:glycosyl hydrolase 53 family protein [uncultured Winogradskyella sp.]
MNILNSAFKKTYRILFLISVVLNLSCNKSNSTGDSSDDLDETTISFYYGADLSYVNEMEDCGATYKNSNGAIQDPYAIFKNEGANLVRLRLWHNPTWTNYSNLQDVKQSIQRAKNEGMKVLLDFHYSDTWTDPSKQQIPAAWIHIIDDTETLGNALYNYTFNTLLELSNEGLLPNIVQVGNEINPMILQDGDLDSPIDWARNSHLINKGIEAVRTIAENKNETVEVMLHIAQPENGLWWFEQATQNGVTDFDWIGLSYYPIWSDYDLNEVQTPLTTLINTYKKKLMIVETAYPFTMANADSANNILGNDALVSGYPASQQGQLNYLNQLKLIVSNAGGQGLVYWEPAWVSTDCYTLWAQGSHWDNATLFDNTNKATLGIQFYNAALND